MIKLQIERGLYEKENMLSYAQHARTDFCMDDYFRLFLSDQRVYYDQFVVSEDGKELKFTIAVGSPMG